MNLTNFLLQRCMCSVFSYACFPGPQISAVTARMCALCHTLILQSLRLRWGTGCLLGINTHRRVEEKVGLGRGEVEVCQRLPKPWSTLYICPTKLERPNLYTSAFISHWMWTTTEEVNLDLDSWRLPKDSIPSIWVTTVLLRI